LILDGLAENQSRMIPTPQKKYNLSGLTGDEVIGTVWDQ